MGEIRYFGDAPVWVEGEPVIGENCWIGPFCLLDASGGLEIGDNTTISGGTHIYTHLSGAGRGSGIVRKPVKIGSNVKIEPHCVVTMGVTIEDNVVVGVNSLVNIDLPEGCKALGTPCRISESVFERICWGSHHVERA